MDIQIWIPVFICILTGVFSIWQLHMKRRDDIIYKSLGDMQKQQEKLSQELDLFIKDNKYEDLKNNFNSLEKRLAINDEITKRVELTLMIMYHPDQKIVIEQLLEEYNGNHYIYTLAKEWANHYNVDINPSLLNKLCRNSSKRG